MMVASAAVLTNPLEEWPCRMGALPRRFAHGESFILQVNSMENRGRWVYQIADGFSTLRLPVLQKRQWPYRKTTLTRWR